MTSGICHYINDPAAQPVANLTPYSWFPPDRITKAIEETIINGREFQDDAEAPSAQRWSIPYWRGLEFDTRPNANAGWVDGVIGFPALQEAELELLTNQPALVAQVNLLLWDRIHDGKGEFRRDSVVVSVKDLCEALGYTKRPDGVFKTRDREAVLLAARLLTTIRMDAVFHPAPRDGQRQAPRRLSGPIWFLTLEGYEKEGTDPDWTPTHIVIRVGDWFTPDWRENNKFVGLISKELAKLESGKQDKWAVIIGQVLAWKFSMDSYRDQLGKNAISEEWLAKTVGLWRYQNRRSQMREKMAKALDKLVKLGIIKRWAWLERTLGEETHMHIEVAWPEAAKAAAGEMKKTLKGGRW